MVWSKFQWFCPLSRFWTTIYAAFSELGQLWLVIDATKTRNHSEIASFRVRLVKISFSPGIWPTRKILFPCRSQTACFNIRCVTGHGPLDTPVGGIPLLKNKTGCLWLVCDACLNKTFVSFRSRTTVNSSFDEFFRVNIYFSSLENETILTDKKIMSWQIC